MNLVNTFRRFLRILRRGLLGFITLLVVKIVLLIVIWLFFRMERTPLPNGLELGHRYIWDGKHDFYLWKKDGELVAPYVLDLLCYDYRYVDASTMDGPTFFLYDIENDVLTLSTDNDYSSRRRESGLNCSPEGTTGYTQFHVGAGIIVHYPERVRDCTLSDPCPF